MRSDQTARHVWLLSDEPLAASNGAAAFSYHMPFTRMRSTELYLGVLELDGLQKIIDYYLKMHVRRSMSIHVYFALF